MISAMSLDLPDPRLVADPLIGRLIDEGWIPGLIVGITSEAGRTIRAYGRRSAKDPRPPAPDSVFQVGSVTKLFTALLLIDLADQKRLDMDAPFSQYLPGILRTPSAGARPVTPADFAMHRAGLPRMPENMLAPDPADPFAGYTVETLKTHLGSFTPLYPTGERNVYSNTGYAALGLLLEKLAGMPYADLVEAKICRPAGMRMTGITWSKDAQSRALPGHRPWNEPIAPWGWDEPAFHAAGALHSTVEDLLTFVEIGGKVKPGPAEADWIPRVWGAVIGEEDLNHAGQDYGFHAYVRCSRKSRIGVVVLANAATTAVSCVAGTIFSLLHGWPLDDIPPLPTTGAPPACPDEYAGSYRYDAEAWATIGGLGTRRTARVTARDGALFLQADHTVGDRLYPESPDSFFDRSGYGRYRFVRDSHGQVTGFDHEIAFMNFKGRAVK